MTILVVGKFCIEGFALHIAGCLGEMGYRVRRFETGYRAKRIDGLFGHRVDQVAGSIHSATDGILPIRAWRMRNLWRVAGEGPIDVAIVCHDFLWPSEVRELKRIARAPVAMWFPDAIVNLGRGFFMTAPYDAVFFKDPYIVHALGGTILPPAYYLPECFNPTLHRFDESDGDDRDYRCDIATAGTQHSWRVSVFSHLAGYDVRIYGPPPPLWLGPNSVTAMYQGRSVHYREKARAFRRARIVLTSLHYGEMWGLNARAFEAAGAGAFQLVDWRPGLDQLFDDGRELVSFRGMADLRRKVDWWLGRDAERVAIAEAGMRRAYAEHTYRIRLELLLDTLGGRERGFPIPSVKGDSQLPTPRSF